MDKILLLEDDVSLIDGPTNYIHMAVPQGLTGNLYRQPA